MSDFNDRKRPTHNDVLAFDIQRGRDHGLQPYVEYIKLCSGIEVSKWKDLLQLMTAEVHYLLLGFSIFVGN